MIRIIASGYEAARSSITHLLLDIWNTAKVQNRLLLTANCLGFTRGTYQEMQYSQPRLVERVALRIFNSYLPVELIVTWVMMSRRLWWQRPCLEVSFIGMSTSIRLKASTSMCYFVGSQANAHDRISIWVGIYEICINYVANVSLNLGLEACLCVW